MHRRGGGRDRSLIGEPIPAALLAVEGTCLGELILIYSSGHIAHAGYELIEIWNVNSCKAS